MLRELSEDVRIRVKDTLRDFRSIVRQHRHDHASSRPASPDAKDQPFPMREIEGLLRPCGQRLRRRDVARRKPCSAQEVWARRRFPARSRCNPIFAREANRIWTANARSAATSIGSPSWCSSKRSLNDFRIRESDFAAVHDALEKRDAELIARLHAETDRDERVSLVAALSSSLFVELVRHEPIKLPVAEPDEQETIDVGHTDRGELPRRDRNRLRARDARHGGRGRSRTDGDRCPGGGCARRPHTLRARQRRSGETS